MGALVEGGERWSTGAVGWLRREPIAAVAIPLGVVIVLLAVAVVASARLGVDGAHLREVEAEVRRALALDALTGGPSAMGAADPGPAPAYALAPLYALSARSEAALALGALVLNAAWALAAVAVAGRLLGRAGVVAATAVVVVHLWAWSPEGVADPWRPALVPLPVLVACLLWAGAWERGWRWFLAGAVPASFAAQAQLAAVPVVIAAAVVGAAGLLLGRSHRAARRAGDGSSPSSPWAPIGVVAVLVVLWAPPAWEQATAAPGAGNLGRVATFLAEVDLGYQDPGDPGRSGVPVFAAVANESTRIPFGWAPAPAPTATVDLQTAVVRWWRAELWVAGLLVAAGLVVVGGFGGWPAVAGLGAVTLATSTAGLFVAVRVPAGRANHELWAVATSLAPAWIGVLALLAGALATRRAGLDDAAPVGAALRVVAVVAGALFVLDARELLGG